MSITVSANTAPFSLAFFGFGLFKCGSSVLVNLPISTAGCSLSAVFSGLFGDGSPRSRSKAIANTRTVTAINTAIMRITQCRDSYTSEGGKFIFID